MVLLLVGAWLGLRRGESLALRSATESAAAQAAPRLADFVEARLTVVESLAREEAHHHMSDEEFVVRAGVLLSSFGGLLAVNWIDGDGIIRITVPPAGNERALGRNLRTHPHAAPYFLQAERSGKPVVTPSIALYQGPRGITSYFPVVRGGDRIGYVNGVFDCGTLVRASLAKGVLDHYLVRVSDEGGLLYESSGFAASRAYASRAETTVGTRRWLVEVMPTADLVAASRSRAPDLLLLLALLLGPATWWIVRERNQKQQALARLQAERHELERQMLEAQKLEAVGRLAGGVAHDFNNLLTAMLGHAELARRDRSLPEKVRADLDVVIDAARRGAEITRDLLTFSRREVVETRAVDVAVEVSRLLPILSHLMREDVELVTDITDQPVVARVAPAQLERALMNLVVNAVDAQPSGGTVTISVRAADEKHVAIDVKDEGEGMTEDVAKRAFEPFFTTKAPGQGTGLGLASVHGMAHQLGGEVSLSTAPGRGTTVRLTLPRADEAATTVDEPVATPTPGRPARILLVEDEPFLRRSAERVLRAEGHHVVSAGDGHAALALCESGDPPEVLVTDEVMPQMRGHELARRLKEKLPELRVLVCSGHAEHLIDHAALDELEAVFLPKPYSASELCAAVARARTPR